MTRFDPYQNFKFRVKWEGRPVAGVNHISALKRTSEVVKDRPARRRSAYEAITLERGITHDPEFETWANRIHSGQPGPDVLRAARHDLRIEVYNEAGQLEAAYLVYGCWVSEYQALPDLDAGGNAVRSSTSGWKTRAGRAMTTSPNPPSRPCNAGRVLFRDDRGDDIAVVPTVCEDTPPAA